MNDRHRYTIRYERQGPVVWNTPGHPVGTEVELVRRDEIAEDVLEAQAALQMGIGVLRLEMSQIPNREGVQLRNLRFSEDRLTEALARCHKLLAQLGRPMYEPATHKAVQDE
jgi:hypothetical protein